MLGAEVVLIPSKPHSIQHLHDLWGVEGREGRGGSGGEGVEGREWRGGSGGEGGEGRRLVTGVHSTCTSHSHVHCTIYP